MAVKRKRPKGRLKGDTTPVAEVVAAVGCPYCTAAKGEPCHRYGLRVEYGPPVPPHPERWVLYRRKLRAQRMTRRLADLTDEDRRRLGLEAGR